MQYKTFSEKQLTSMLWWKMPQYKDLEGILCDGSVRSGKTLTMTNGFVLWSMTNFSNQTFAMCGKTIESLRRNVITPMFDWLGGVVIIKEHRSINAVDIFYSGHKNRYYLFGGRDESSASLIQGITLAGVLLDEVALMPRSFVEQAIARCSVPGSKLWFNCNPDGPEHWFFKEWVQKAKEKRVLHLHFTMVDNHALSDEIRERYERLYSGVFYDRFVRGLWCVAEGLVYPHFNKQECVVSSSPDYGDYYISVDYGTVNPFSAGLWCLCNGKATRIAEYYYNSRERGAQLTDEEYYQAVCAVAGEKDIICIVVVPSAASFIECIRRHGNFIVRKAKNDVLDGIRTVSNMLSSGTIKIHENCKDAIREFQLYRWDEDKTSDAVIKENDHAMDDIRYFCYTILRKELQYDEW